MIDYKTIQCIFKRYGTKAANEQDLSKLATIRHHSSAQSFDLLIFRTDLDNFIDEILSCEGTKLSRLPWLPGEVYELDFSDGL